MENYSHAFEEFEGKMKEKRICPECGQIWEHGSDAARDFRLARHLIDVHGYTADCQVDEAVAVGGKCTFVTAISPTRKRFTYSYSTGRREVKKMKKFKLQKVVVHFGGSPRFDIAGDPQIVRAANPANAARNALGTRGTVESLERDAYGPIWVRGTGSIDDSCPGVMITPA